MTGRGAPQARAAYVTVNSRMEEIRELWGREPTANELRALAELPLDSKPCLDDDSENGRKIHQLLRSSEQNRDVSLLEEAGRLLWEQSMKLPPHWQSNAPSPLVLNDLPDDAYQFSPISNDPFAKVGSVRTVENKKEICNIPVTTSLVSNSTVATESHLKELENTAYPDLLVNPPQRWLRKSPHSLQPIRLIPPIAFTNIYPMLHQQAQRQIAAPSTNSEQKKPSVSKKATVKASDSNRIRKPAAAPKAKAKAAKNTLSSIQRTGGLQGLQKEPPQQPTTLFNPTLSPIRQQAYFAIPSSGAIHFGVCQNPYTTKANQHARVPPSGATLPPTNSVPPSPFLVSQSLFPAFTAPGMTASTTRATVGLSQNRHPCTPTAIHPPLPPPPTIRIPTVPIASNQQGELDMSWLQLTPGNYRSVTAAAEATVTQPYDEVYRLAKETAENLAKMLAEQ